VWLLYNVQLNHDTDFCEVTALEFANTCNRSASFVGRATVLTALLLCAFSAGVQAQVSLLPAPREVHLAQKTPLPAKIQVLVPGHDASDEFAASDLEDAIKQIPQGEAARPAAIYRISLLRADAVAAKPVLDRAGLAFDAAMQSEGYVLVIENQQAYVIGASSSGVFYGVQTLKQLLPLPSSERALPTGSIRDWPAMRYRAVQDDLSRGPVPTLEFQKHQIRVLASFKANIYSPYFEHTLLYPNQPMAGPPGGTMTPAEVKELVAYARQYHVTILPQQEAFGHLHHVLKYELYQDAAETPHGHVLAPGQPATMPLIKDWFTQIAAEFPSPFIHIGADETWDLGVGRTQEDVHKKGYGPVYVAFLKQIHDELDPLHRRLLFWGDIGGKDPDAIAGLPKDMIAVPWNYWDSTGFDKMIEPFAKAGMETWIAPGDANWNEVFPQTRTALWNIQGFARDGQRMGSTGMINTVWNDDGEGLFNLDWYGVLFGPVAAWQQGESSIPDYQVAYGPVFHGDTSGKIDEAEKELMSAQEVLSNAKLQLSSDAVFWLDPWSAQGQEISVKLVPVARDLRLHAERAIVILAQLRQANPKLKEPDALTAMDMGARRLDLIGMKFQLAQEIAGAYAKAVQTQRDKTQHDATGNMLYEISGNNGRCQDLRDAFSALKAQYAQVWMSENRPYWLNNVMVRYDLEIEKWQRRGELFQQGIWDWNHGRDLPSQSAMGLPVTDQQGGAAH
jgi:hexosaminidase